MWIKTKKYALAPSTYIRLGFYYIFLAQWWVTLAFCLLGSVLTYYTRSWWSIVVPIVYLLYLAFLWFQFYAVTMLEQNRLFFARMAYQIDSTQIILLLNGKQGMPISWDQIQWAKSHKDSFVLFLSRAQFLHLPHKIFQGAHEVQFLQALLKRKKLI